jgi:hypothetical protein
MSSSPSSSSSEPKLDYVKTLEKTCELRGYPLPVYEFNKRDGRSKCALQLGMFKTEVWVNTYYSDPKQDAAKQMLEAIEKQIQAEERLTSFSPDTDFVALLEKACQERGYLEPVYETKPLLSLHEPFARCTVKISQLVTTAFNPGHINSPVAAKNAAAYHALQALNQLDPSRIIKQIVRTSSHPLGIETIAALASRQIKKRVEHDEVVAVLGADASFTTDSSCDPPLWVVVDPTRRAS